jgi:hypothetical protein
MHADLVATLGEEAIAYNIVTKYLREVQTGPHDAISRSLQFESFHVQHISSNHGIQAIV